MKFKPVVFSVLFLISAAFSGILSAQEGHPLKGTWRGVIATGDDSEALLMIMDFDGENITGMINPGRSSFRFSSSGLNADSWLFSAAATTRDGVDISFQATLNEIGARNRYLEGTWTQAGRTYPFKVTRE